MRWRTIFPLLMLIVANPLFAQNHAVPYVNQPLDPASVAPWGPGFVLTVNGTGFVPGATVNWNGTALSTSYVSGSRLAVHVSKWHAFWPQTAAITVTNPAPGGGTSNTVYFTVTEPTRSVAFTRSTVAVGYAPVSVVTADFNNDGIPDLAVTNECGASTSCAPSMEGTVSILLGNGNGGFRLAATLSTHGEPVYAVTGDFNGDGKQDLVVASDPNCQGCATLTFFAGNGDGTFSAGRTLIPGLDGGFRGMTAGDFNRDGHLDLAVSAAAGAPYNFTLPGNGDGTFTQSYSQTITSVGALGTADLNRDGILDLASIAPLRAYMGKGDGTFAGPATMMMRSMTAVAPGFAPFQSLAVGDFNGDGIPDVAYIDTSAQKLYVYRGNGDGSFTLASSQTTTTTAADVSTADMNGDGKLDLVAVDSAGNVDVYLGYGDATFAAPVAVAAGNAPAGPIAIADFNRDGRMDIAVVNSQDGTVSLLQQTSGYEATVDPPISRKGGSLFNARQTIPVRFSLKHYGVRTCELPLAMITVQRTQGSQPETLDFWSYAARGDLGPFFAMNEGGCQEMYNLPAQRLGAGSYQVTINVDGSVVGQAAFGVR